MGLNRTKLKMRKKSYKLVILRRLVKLIVFFFFNILFKIFTNSSNENKLIKERNINKNTECDRERYIIINKKIEEKNLFDNSLI